METSRQVVRWSVPGGVLVGMVAVFRIVHALTNRSVPLVDWKAFDASFVALGVVSAIPVGYMIYQLYFLAYDRGLPFMNIVALDRAGDVFFHLGKEERAKLYEHVPPVKYDAAGDVPSIHRATERRPLIDVFGWSLVSPHRLPAGSDRERRNDYRLRRGRNMAILRAWLDTCADRDAERLKRQYTSISDIYHSQGASRFAVLVAYAVAESTYAYASGVPTPRFVYRWVPEPLLLEGPCGCSGWGYVVNIVIAVLVTGLLHRIRRDTWYAARDTLAQSMVVVLRRS